MTRVLRGAVIFLIEKWIDKVTDTGRVSDGMMVI